MSFQWQRRAAPWRSIFRASSILPLVIGGVSAGAAKPPAPTLRIPLASLGFPGYRVALMHAGASMTTLHLLDKDHLLFTFGLRGLVPRLPGDDANDQDRLVGAELVQISTGKVLDRTEWHLHDHGRYLWGVGHGVFVLRSGDELSSFVPLRGLPTHSSFLRIAMPHHPGRPELISGSPDGEVITVESQRPNPAEEQGTGEAPKPKHTVMEFYRIAEPKEADQPVQLRAAGSVGSPGLLRLPLDGDGYLWANPKDADRYRWSVSFNEYEGKGQNLVALDSSCAPRMELLARSQFVAITCKGSEDSKLLSSYGFDGQLNWQQTLGAESLQPPTFVAAPEAGRFAMSRLLASSAGLANSSLDDGTLSQSIRVFSTVSGFPLLSVLGIPAARTPENFDLSPDGRTLAVLAANTIDLYTLPALSDSERKDLADAETMLPPRSTGPVILRRISRPIVASEQPIASEETTAPQPASPATSTPATPPAPASAAAVAPPAAATTTAAGAIGDATPTHRKAPTLLAPGEKPDGQTKHTANPNR